jgi:hypothetical protein
VLVQALLLEGFKPLLLLAGLLTCSVFEPPSRSLRSSGVSVAQKLFTGAYSSGSVQDFHLIPYFIPASEDVEAEYQNQRQIYPKYFELTNGGIYGVHFKSSPKQSRRDYRSVENKDATLLWHPYGMHPIGMPQKQMSICYFGQFCTFPL